jgi:hypothetical protein
VASVRRAGRGRDSYYIGIELSVEGEREFEKAVRSEHVKRSRRSKAAQED